MLSLIFNKVRAKGELIRLECTLNAYYNKLNTEELSEKKLHSLKKRIENCEKDIEWLKNKLR